MVFEAAIFSRSTKLVIVFADITNTKTVSIKTEAVFCLDGYLKSLPEKDPFQLVSPERLPHETHTTPWITTDQCQNSECS